MNFVCVFKQKTAYEMRISDWSSDVCSSDLLACIRGLDPVDVPGAGHANVRRQGAQSGFEAFAAERRQGRLALEDDHVRRRSGAAGGVIVAGAGARDGGQSSRFPASDPYRLPAPPVACAASLSSAARSSLGGM